MPRRWGRWAVATAALLTGACSGGDRDAAVEPPSDAGVIIDTTIDTTVDTTVDAEQLTTSSPPTPSTTAAAPASSGRRSSVATTTPTTAPPSTAPPSTPRCGTTTSFADAVDLTVWHSLGGDAAAWFDEMVVEFEREHPAIHIGLERPDGGWPAGVALLGGMPVDDRPDVVLASELTTRLQADSDAFVPIEECTGSETPEQFTDLHPVIDATYRVDDVLWAAPYNASTPVLVYDGNLWRRAGLDPDEPPSTIDDLEVVIRRLRDSGEAATGITLYDRSAMWLVTVPASQAGDLLVEPANGRAGLSIDGVALVTTRAVDTLERFRRLRREGYVNWVGLNQSDSDDLVTLVSPTELSGMTLHTSASLGDIYRLQEDDGLKDVDVRAAPFPGPGVGAPVGGGAWWLLDRGDPVRIDASWVFVDWITQPERVAELAAYTGYVPTTSRAADHPVMVEAWTDRPAYRAGYDQIVSTSGSAASASLQVGPQVDVWRALEIAAATTIDTDRDPTDALTEAEAIVRSYLDAYAEVHGGG